jgi:hypothetical protein
MGDPQLCEVLGAVGAVGELQLEAFPVPGGEHRRPETVTRTQSLRRPVAMPRGQPGVLRTPPIRKVLEMRSGTIEDEVMAAMILGGWDGPKGREQSAEGCLVMKEVDARYVDADGDDLLDTVELVERVLVVRPEGRRVVSTTRTVAAEIGDDGIPHRMMVSVTA